MGEGIHQQAGDDAIQIGQARDLYIGPRRLPSGAPFQAPPLPIHFVPRPEVSETLKARLLAGAAVAPGTLVVSAIHGLGGIGKSTLAAALAYGPAVQTRFSDGILWATLGQQPDLLSLLSGWVQAVGDYDFRPTTVESVSTHLHSLLQDKAALLVVDDAWDPSHARPFLIGGPRCRVLITTREALIAKAVGGDLYDLDVMTTDQAQALLAGRLGRNLERTERGQALHLAEAVGYLPLALELAAAQVADGVPWAELLADLRAEIARLEALDLPGAEEVTDEATRKRISLLASFHLSLWRLADEKRRAFAWLGVLPEDVTLTPAMAATLWEMEVRKARETLRYLRDKALLLSGVPQPDGTLTYRLHDLLHDLARRLLTDPPTPENERGLPGLGLTLPAAHAALLKRYQARTQDSLWHTLPDDGYIHAHLTWHLEQARWIAELHALLRQETAEGRNGWYQARDRLGQTVGYMADVAHAWRLAEEACANRQSPIAIGLQHLYALIAASLNSLSKNIPPALLVALVQKGVWTPVQGLAYARRMPDPAQRAEALVGLLPHLLSAPPRGEALQEALAAVRAIRSSLDKAQALAKLAPHLPKPLLREALTAARAIAYEKWRAEALAGLLPRLAELGNPQEALAAAQEIETEKYQAMALAGMAPHLPEPLLREALAAARAISSYRRARALAGLAPHLPEPLRSEALQEAPTAARGAGPVDDIIALDLGYAERLERLASHPPELLLREVLAEALAIENEEKQAEALAELAPHLPEPLLREALAVVRGVRDENDRILVLAGLAPHLPDPSLEEALAAARAIENEEYRTKALAGLAPHLPEPLLEEALAAARAIENQEYRAKALAGLPLPLVRASLLQEVLETVRAIGAERWRTKILVELVPHLPEPLLQEVLETVGAIEDEEKQVETVVELPSHLPEPFLKETLAAAQEIENEEKRAEELVELAPHLPEPLLGEALAAAQAIENWEYRAEALAGLAPHLSEPLLQKALETVRAIRTERWQVEALVRLAPYLSEQLLQEVPETVLAIGAERWRTKALLGLALHLPEPLLQKAVWEIRSSVDRAWKIQSSVDRAREIGWEEFLAKALAEVAPYISGWLEEEALTAAQATDEYYEYYRTKALTGLAPHLAQLPRQRLYPLWQEILHSLATRTRRDFLADLHALSPVIVALGGAEAVAETFRAIQDVGRWWP